MTNTQYVSAPPKQRIRPAFKITKLDGKRTVTKFIKDARTGKIARKEVEEDAGYLLTCMNGSSIRVSDAKKLARLGITELVPLINEETGDVVGTIDL